MAWTYDPALPTDKDSIRFLLGDTESTDPLLTDEEIAAAQTLLSGEGNYSIAAYLADRIAAKWAKKRDKTVGRLSISYGAQWERYRALADDLRQAVTHGPGRRLVGPPVLSGGGPTYLGDDPGQDFL